MRISDWSSDVCSSDLRLVIKALAGHFGRQLILRLNLVVRRLVAARAFEHLLFIGAREVYRRFAFLPRRGDFLERLVDLARRIDLADRDALDQNAGAILVEQLLHPLLDLRLDFDAPRADRLDKIEMGDRKSTRLNSSHSCA